MEAFPPISLAQLLSAAFLTSPHAVPGSARFSVRPDGEGAGLADVLIRDVTDDSRHVTPDCLFILRPPAPLTQAEHASACAPADHDAALTYLHQALDRDAAAVLAPTTVFDRISESDWPAHVARIGAARVDQALAGRIAEAFFRQPSQQLKLIGVTGTSGKTTTAFLIQHLLNHAGIPCGLIGTVKIDVGCAMTDSGLKSEIPNLKSPIPNPPSSAPLAPHPSSLPTNTTPGSVEFSRLLAQMVRNGCRAAVAEVSSHALHQGRTAALHFAAGILTNLTGDHLDYHKTMDAYADAKAILFEQLDASAAAIVNAQDHWAHRMIRNCNARIVETAVQDDLAAPSCPSPPGGGREGASTATRHARFDDTSRVVFAPSPSPSRGEGGMDSAIVCIATILQPAVAATRAQFVGPWGDLEINLPFVGRHNVANALQAAAAAHAVAPQIASTLADGLEYAPAVPGRLERVHSPESEVRSLKSGTLDSGLRTLDFSSPAVFIDYAHKADALENVLTALRPLIDPAGRLILVFGCGGDRDKTKRPIMGQIALRLADRVIVTSDNPRTEDPQAIIDDILRGVQSPSSIVHSTEPETPDDGRWTMDSALFVEPDRAKAIAQAILEADPHDTVLIAGKGHEDYQIIGKSKRHFDDREHAAAALEKRQPVSRRLQAT